MQTQLLRPCQLLTTAILMHNKKQEIFEECEVWPCFMPTTKSPNHGGDVAALLRSHMIGLLPFESTIEQTTETMPLSLTQ